MLLPPHQEFVLSLTPSHSGLVFIPSAIGMLSGINIFGALSDRLVKSKMSEGQRHRPELRLSPFFTVPAGLLIPTGLFIYGWTIEYHVHWIAPMIGVCVFAFGLMGIMVRFLFGTLP